MTNLLGSPTPNKESHVSTMTVRRKEVSATTIHVETMTHGPLFSDKYTVDALNAVVPESIAKSHLFNSAIIGSDAPAFASPLYQKILYSVANNFAGLEAIPMVKIIQYLQAETDQKLSYLLSSIGGHSVRAIAQNIFKGAIESGDHRIVNILLNERAEDIHLNKQFLYVDDCHWTPIERAVNLRHVDVVKVLLEHRADVNRTHSNGSGPRGALECAVHSSSSYRWRHIDPDLELFNLVLNAGGHLQPTTIRSILEECKSSDIAYSYICKNAKKSVTEMNKCGVFCAAIMFLDEQRSTDVINLMIELNADLNYEVGDAHDGRFPPRIIDVVSKRGNLQLVRLLRSLDVGLTSDTLPCAVASGNEELVRTLLFEMDADACSFGKLHITPLAAAIRLQNSDLVALLERHGAVDALSDSSQARSALKAASKVGNIHFIEYLIHLGALVTPGDLGIGLIHAARDGREEVARALIDAGADTNFHAFHAESPLVATLKCRQNPNLVQALLDGDAYPDYDSGGACLRLAIEWGDVNVVKSLIHAGANPNATKMRIAPLTTAVRCRREDLVDLLLKAGAELNEPQACIIGGTALWAASKNEDLEMIRRLFELGADPDDQKAIQVASKLANPEILNLIIKKNSERYPRGYNGNGSMILKMAIDNRDAQQISRLLQRGANPTIISHEVKVARRFAMVNSLGYAILRDEGSNIRLLDSFFSRSRCDPDNIVCESFKEIHQTQAPPRMTALLLATKIKDVTTIESLIRYGANVNLPARGAVKRTPLQQASEAGSIQIVQLLIQYGAKINGPPADRGGATALQAAATHGYAAIIELLLEKGAVVDAPGSKTNGLSALECASQNGRLDVVQMLLNAGAGSKIGNASQVHSSMSLAKGSGHFPISDLLADHLKAQKWSDTPEPVDHEEPNFSLDIRSEGSAVPAAGDMDSSAKLDFNDFIDFNLNNPSNLDNTIDFSSSIKSNEQMLLEDGMTQDQFLVPGYNGSLFNDNDFASTPSFDDFDDLWSPTSNH